MADEQRSILGPGAAWHRMRHTEHTRILYDPESFSSVLLAALVDCYGLEAAFWAPTTIREQVFLDFGKPLPDFQFARLMAAIAILSSNDFYKRLPRFISLCNILWGHATQPNEFYPADVLTMAWGVTEAALIDPPETEAEYEFAPAIHRYVRTMLDLEGFVQPPTSLAWVVQDGWKPDFRAFSGMPPLFQAEYETQEGRSEEVNWIVHKRIREWTIQMSRIVPEERLLGAYAVYAERAMTVR